MAQFNVDDVKKIKEKLEEISKARTDYDIFRDFIISCKNNNITIPEKLKKFIILELEK